MLLELRVSNFAIIDNVHISFRGGLNVISGETGAGKSILLKSLGLLMGEKADAMSVRTGADQAVIEGSFDISKRPDIHSKLESMGIEHDGETMVVRRIVSVLGASGSSRAKIYVNGSIATLSALRDVVSPLVEVAGSSAPLIEMTGQHDNRNLLSKSYHLELLDQYAGTLSLRSDFGRLFRRAQEIRSELDAIKSNSRERAQRLDFLIFSRDEIRALSLSSGDETTIESEAKRVKHATRLMEFAAHVESTLDGEEDSILTLLGRIASRGHELAVADPSLMERLATIEQAQVLLQDASHDFRSYGESLDINPERLEELEDRLSRLRQLQKKYGGTADAILAALEAIETEIETLDASDERIEGLEADLQATYAEMKRLGLDLHERRQAAATLFEKEVNAELEDLNMKGVEFLISIQRLTSEPMDALVSGFSDIEYMTRSGRGDTARPLGKAASGGELSRILLSVKRVVGASAFPRTYLFDEVDSGVSGETAEKVGLKLREIACGQQVITVTHLPQVACSGDLHFYIEKSKADKKSGVASMTVTEMMGDSRVHEIARLISGEKLSPTSIAHAKQLLENIQRHDEKQDELAGLTKKKKSPVSKKEFKEKSARD